MNLMTGIGLSTLNDDELVQLTKDMEPLKQKHLGSGLEEFYASLEDQAYILLIKRVGVDKAIRKVAEGGE